jgi:hypothetical protein
VNKKILFGYIPSMHAFKPREDSPRVLFLGEGVAASTLETLLQQRVRIEKVISALPDDPVRRTAEMHDISFGTLNDHLSLFDIGLGTKYDYAVVAFTGKILPANNFPRGKKGELLDCTHLSFLHIGGLIQLKQPY